MFFCKQKTAFELRISDWSLDVCSSDLHACSALSEGAQPLHGRLRDHRPVELPSEPGTARISIGGSSRDRLHERLILIGGSGYAGEMKNAVITVLNLVLPPLGALPSHCSAKLASDGFTSIYVGGSGAG